MKTLIIIPARKGSKGLPGKNVKILGGRPLVAYSIEFAQRIRGKEDVICISTNDEAVLNVAATYGIDIPFIRPEELASDHAGSYDVIMHALGHYEQSGSAFDAVLLLQPTSPYRLPSDYAQLLAAFAEGVDMAVSVKESKENPYFTLFEENTDGFLEKSKQTNFTRRQDCPPVYAFNGSMYLMNTVSLRKQYIYQFQNIRKMVMPEERSIDIDNQMDWVLAEYLLNTYNHSIANENS